MEERTERMVQRRILVVEADCATREALVELFGLWGHDAREADDPTDALTQAVGWLPEIVFVEVPGLYGYEVARRLGLLPLSERPTVIAMATSGRPADLERARLAGCHFYLLKPCDPCRLAGFIEEAEEAWVARSRPHLVAVPRHA